MASAPKPPPAPDPNVIAGAQSTANINSASAQAALNNVSQYTPWGSLVYNQSGTGPNGIPTYSATQTAGPGQQALLNTGTQMAQNLQNSGQYSGAPNLNPSIQSAVDLYKQYMQPQFDTQRSTTQSQLQNQGFVPGDVGYDRSMTALNNQQDSLVGSQLPSAFNMAVQQYQLPLQTAQSLISPQPAPYTNTPQTGVSPTDVTQAYNINQQAQEYNYGQQNANYNAMMGGLFSIPSALAGGWARGGFQMPSFGGGGGGGGYPGSLSVG